MDGPAGLTGGLHYTACGLDYVYLLNGYLVHHTVHGDGISIKSADQLHERIALDVISRAFPLRGQEVRFLRGMLRLSQDALAKALRRQRGSLARWEAEPRRAIPAAADGALRMFYALTAGDHEDARRLVALLRVEVEPEPEKRVAPRLLLRKAREWRVAAG